MAIVGAGDSYDVIKNLDLLFDATNGPSKPTCRRPPKFIGDDDVLPVRTNVTEKSGHVQFWQKMTTLLSDMKFFD